MSAAAEAAATRDTPSKAETEPARKMAVPAPGGPTPIGAVVPGAGAPALPDGVRAALQRIRAEVEKHCEYVGPNFAREVRRMAEAVEPHRAVYGEATPDEAAALAEEGIDVARIPWVPRADS